MPSVDTIPGTGPSPPELRLGKFGEPAWDRPRIQEALDAAVREIAPAVSKVGLTPFGFLLYHILQEKDAESRERLWEGIVRVLGEIAHAVPLPKDYPREARSQGFVLSSLTTEPVTQRRVSEGALRAAFEAVLAHFMGTGKETPQAFIAQCWAEVQTALLESIGLKRIFPFAHLLQREIAGLTVEELTGMCDLRPDATSAKGPIMPSPADPSPSRKASAPPPQPVSSEKSEDIFISKEYISSYNYLEKLYRDREVRTKYAGQVLAVSGDRIWGSGGDEAAALSAAGKNAGCPVSDELTIVAIPPITLLDRPMFQGSHEPPAKAAADDAG